MGNSDGRVAEEKNHDTVNTHADVDQIVPPTNCVRNAFRIFQSQGVIGRGSTCVVVQANVTSHGEIDNYSFIDANKMRIENSFAVKVMARSNSSAVRAFKREATILQDLRHENIIQLYGLFMDTHRLFIVQQLCLGGTLLRHIRRRKKLKEDACRQLMRQILQGIAHLHQKGMAHRDIKPANIMFVDKKHTQIVLADFGQTVCLRDNPTVRTRAGTPMFFAPELCARSRVRALTAGELFACDMWMAGVTCFQMLTGTYPYYGNSRKELYRNIRTEDVPVSRLKLVSDDARSFTLGLLEKDWGSRMDVVSALMHPWLKGIAPKLLRAGGQRKSVSEVFAIDDMRLSAGCVEPAMYDDARI